MKRIILLTISCVVINSLIFSQNQGVSNPLQYAVRFIKEAPDARGMGNGFTGAATTSDANSNFWNPAKFAFINDSSSNFPGIKDMGVAFSYFSGFYEFAEGDFHCYLSAYKYFKKQTFALSFKYDRIGKIYLTDFNGNFLGESKPKEFYFDLSYSRRFSKTFSAGLALRNIVSDLDIQYIQGQEIKKGHSIAMDLAVYYKQPLSIGSLDYSQLSIGLNISNIGSKISYSDDDDDKDFIPTNLRLGASFLLDKNEHRFTISADINKLLIPTSPIYQTDTLGNPVFDENGFLVVDKGMDPNVSVFKGMIQSFYDAPRGFEEEIEEIYYGIGTEYWYNKIVAFRLGYYHEHENKGVKKYWTFGLSGRYKFIGLDLTYINQDKNPYLKNAFFATLVLAFNTGI